MPRQNSVRRSPFNINEDGIFIADNNTIKLAVNSYLDRNVDNLPPIGTWDVSNVTNMDSLFHQKNKFNEDISQWNVSNVTSMRFMFFGAHKFNQPLNNWNVSNVEDMAGMFNRAYLFNNSINGWNVSNVEDMNVMFSQTNFNQPLNDWDVSNVENMSGMFSYAEQFNQPLNNWIVSSVKSMEKMFENAFMFRQDLSMWIINPDAKIRDMFFGASRMPEAFIPKKQRRPRNSNQSRAQQIIQPVTQQIPQQTTQTRPRQTRPRQTRTRQPRTQPTIQGNELLEELQPDLQPQTPIQDTPSTPELLKIYDAIKVFDPINVEEMPISKFFEENEDYAPFIIRNPQGTFTGEAINWPASSSSGKEFIECLDNTPLDWQGNSYSKYIKPNGRRFIKMNISGSTTMVVKPIWYNAGTVPGTKIFNLVPADKVLKFMSKPLAIQELPEDFSALGAEHCNQLGEVGTYTLEEITIDELNNIINQPLNGGKNKKLFNKTFKKRTTFRKHTNKKRRIKNKSRKNKK